MYKNSIRLQNINPLFEEKLFCQEVNFTLKPNSARVLYGGSGSGKTSLFNILVGLANVNEAGELYWQGTKITSLKEAHRLRAKYMAVVFSNFSFIQDFSIKDNILLGASLSKKKDIEARLNRLIEEVLNFKSIDINIDLGTLIEKGEIQKLSNGQKEIIAIASALLMNTKFFIADEMLRSFPDDTKKIVFERLIRYFKEKKIGFFYVTHWEEATDFLKEYQFSHEKYVINKKARLCEKIKEYKCV